MPFHTQFFPRYNFHKLNIIHAQVKEYLQFTREIVHQAVEVGDLLEWRHKKN